MSDVETPLPGNVGLPRPAACGDLLWWGATGRPVFRLALPVLAEQLLIYCVGLFDTFLAGRISTNATLAIGLSAYVGWLATLAFALVGAGTVALVARHWGARDYAAANRFFNQAVPLALMIGGVVCGLIFSIAPELARLQNMSGETREIAVRYLRIDAVGFLFTSLSLVGTAALRGVGDMRSPMFVLGIVNILNIAASTAFVYGFGPIPPLGVDGIVGGTLVARACGGVLMLALLSRGLSGLRLRLSEMRFEAAAVLRILRIGIPAAIDGALTWGGHFAFVMIIARLAAGEAGHAMFAAHIIGIQVEGLTFLPATAWGAAAATAIGQALGAGDPQRARRLGHAAALQCSVLGAIAAATYYFGAPEIFRLMHRSEAVWKVGVPALRFLAFFQVPLVLLIVYVQALRGAGDTRYPMLFSLFGILGVRLPVAYLCGIVWQGGLTGAWIGMCTDVSFRALLAVVHYARGRWVHSQI
jgi:putative MATE family efflux protein